MASPVSDSYSCASGGVISAGRYRITPGDYRLHIRGQSNAVGYGALTDLSASPLNADAGLAGYAAAPFARVYIWTGSAYQQLNMGSNNAGNSATQFGPEFGIAVRWMRETTSGNLYIHKHASGGSSITNFVPAHWTFATWSEEVTTADGILGSTPTPAGFLWVQGESDAAQTQGWYQTHLESILTGLETDGLIDSGSKRILMNMHPSTATYGAGVAAAKTAIASASPTNTTAPQMPYYMLGDNIHITARGQVQVGYDAFETMFNVGHISV
jgi:hypothetical protein